MLLAKHGAKVQNFHQTDAQKDKKIKKKI